MDTKSGVRVATVHVADALDGAGRWERIGRAVLGFCASEPTAAETVSLGLAHHYYGAEMGGEGLAASTKVAELTAAVVATATAYGDAQKVWSAARSKVRQLTDENCGTGTQAQIREALREARRAAAALDRAGLARALAIQTLQVAVRPAMAVAS